MTLAWDKEKDLNPRVVSNPRPGLTNTGQALYPLSYENLGEHVDFSNSDI